MRRKDAKEARNVEEEKKKKRKGEKSPLEPGLTNDASLHMPHLPSRFMLKLQTCLYTMRAEKEKRERERERERGRERRNEKKERKRGTRKTFCTFFAATLSLARDRSATQEAS